MNVDSVVVGGGVVGLAIARALVLRGREVVLLESAAVVGGATSSRNSGVIHSGIYYAPGSLKARLCVRGRHLLYEFCAGRGVEHRRCGKIIVATAASELEVLRGYERRGAENGVDDLRLLSAGEAAAMEPEIRCVAALSSPSTGIIDAHELMHRFVADIESGGAYIALSSALQSARLGPGGFEIRVADGLDTQIQCRELVNSAGLEAPSVAGRIEGLAPGSIPMARFARGHYYALRGPTPFRQLVYPIADAHSLGIHATLDLGGRVRFGPDVEWIESVDYDFGPDLRERFAELIRRYYPAIEASRLIPDYTGIRPKINSRDEPAADFRIDSASAHGVPGLVNLFGIESPGLTASLAIAETVASELDILL